jgi:hypothetical protein
LKPLVQSYLDGSTELAAFKSRIDSLSKSSRFWGFKGIKGQMFFNMVVNVADDLQECDQEIKSAISLPANEQIASSRIKTFASYVQRLGEQWVSAGNTRHGCPKAGSIPFFLSYFWQIQNRDTWPVYYTSGVNAMVDLNLWQPSGDLADDYVAYKRLHEELASLFAADTGRAFHLYDVEHVFWLKGGNPYEAAQAEEDRSAGHDRGVRASAVAADDSSRLPESYVPPIIAIVPRIARHEPGLDELARRSGTSLDRAFEKYIDAALTMLGAIRSIKMETDVNEVILIEADALVAMVDAKLRAPLQVTLGPDGLQRLFASSGILSAGIVIEQF